MCRTTLIVLLQLLMCYHLLGQSVSIETDKTKYKFDEKVIVLFTIDFIEDSLTLPEFEGLQLIGNPTKTSFVAFENGKLKRSKSWKYTLLAKRSGKIVIKSPSFFDDGKEIKSDEKTIQILKENLTDIYLFQNGRELLVGNSEIEVKKEKFALRFFNKKYNFEAKEFYAVQIACFLNKKEMGEIEIGKSTYGSQWFGPGTGMAAHASGKYESLIFDDSGHHYLFYENHKNSRLKLIENSGEYLKLEFEIEALSYNKKEEKMSETKLRKFYLAILTDRNLNGKIDRGELHKLTVKIK